jgi:hypothetical protein
MALEVQNREFSPHFDSFEARFGQNWVIEDLGSDRPRRRISPRRHGGTEERRREKGEEEEIYHGDTEARRREERRRGRG